MDNRPKIDTEIQTEIIPQKDSRYRGVISLIGKTHAGLLEMVKLELDRLGIYDINNVQAMMLFNIGEAEMTVGELTLRGCYFGSNVSYNVKKMVETKYLIHNRSTHDKRCVRVKLTEKGGGVIIKINAMFDRQRESMGSGVVRITEADLTASIILLNRLERMWGQEHSLIGS